MVSSTLYLAKVDLRLRCGRLIYPKGAIVDLPDWHKHTKRWLKRKELEVVKDGERIHDNSKTSKVGK